MLLGFARRCIFSKFTFSWACSTSKLLFSFLVLYWDCLGAVMGTSWGRLGASWSVVWASRATWKYGGADVQKKTLFMYRLQIDACDLTEWN